METMVMSIMNAAFWNKKKVFVTGHTGFKGSWLCMLLNYMGAEVSGYALDPPTDPSLYNLCRIDDNVQSTIADIRDLETLKAAMQKAEPDIVIHMAAQALVRYSYQNPVDTYAVNVMGTVNLLEAVRQTPSVKAVVNVTTDKCYENKEWLWAYREDEPMGGYDPYSSSKACSEIVTAAYRRSFFGRDGRDNRDRRDDFIAAIATARAGNVIGGGDWAEDRLIPDFVRAIRQNEKIRIRSPRAIRPWQHVLEPLSGYLSLAEKLFEEGHKYEGAWNFGPDDSDAKSVEWIVSKMCSDWGYGAAYEIDTHPQPHEATSLKLDCSKAKVLLDWHPRWTLEKTLHTIIQFTQAWQRNENLKHVCQEQIKDYFTLKH